VCVFLTSNTIFLQSTRSKFPIFFSIHAYSQCISKSWQFLTISVWKLEKYYGLGTHIMCRPREIPKLYRVVAWFYFICFHYFTEVDNLFVVDKFRTILCTFKWVMHYSIVFFIEVTSNCGKDLEATQRKLTITLTYT